MSFYLSKDTELSIDLLHKMLNRFLMSVEPKLRMYKNYYDGKQAIINKHYSDETKPCSKVVTNYCKNIVDSYTGYLASPGYISYSSEQDIEYILNILRYNDYQTEDSDFLLDAVTYGVAHELMYIDTESKIRFKLINPMQSFGIFDSSLTNDLLYFVRFYRINDWDDSNIYSVDVYSDSDIRHYRMTGENGNLTYISTEPHYFSQCPANIFILPDEKSIFDCVMNLQDAANEILSSEIDDYSAFCDAYLALTGCDLDNSDLTTMKENRVLILPEGSVAQWLTKATSDVQVENMLKRVQESIYRIAACPDFSAESFVGGVSSGIAIRYRLTGMETRAAKIESEMKKALQRRIEIICGIASLKLGEEVWRDINISFKRNIPVDVNAIIQLVNSLQGIVSNETLLSQIDFVADVNAEIEKVKKQKQENINLYSFDNYSTIEEDIS